MSRETPDSDNDATCAELRNDEKFMSSVDNSRPVSMVSDAAPNEKRWVDIVSGNFAITISQWLSNAFDTGHICMLQCR